MDIINYSFFFECILVKYLNALVFIYTHFSFIYLCIRIKYFYSFVFVYKHLSHLPSFVIRNIEYETSTYLFVVVSTGVQHFYPFVLVI